MKVRNHHVKKKRQKLKVKLKNLIAKKNYKW